MTQEEKDINPFMQPAVKNTQAKESMKALSILINKSEKDDQLRSRLLVNPKETIERELKIKLPDDHEICIHEKAKNISHFVIPPKCQASQEEREAARTGMASLEFLQRTMFDPVPPPVKKGKMIKVDKVSRKVLIRRIYQAIDQGLEFLETTINERGAWYCIRTNIAKPDVPRHYERPPFVAAYAALALESCDHPQAKQLCASAKRYILGMMEFPGLWRYYLHLPPDLDSTTLCALVVGDHPWISLGQNLAKILTYRNEDKLFNTWILNPEEPDVASKFRMEADPVVNANIIALLGDCEETKYVQIWLESLLAQKKLDDSSKWYTDTIAICYAIARAIRRTDPLLVDWGPILAENIMASHNPEEGFGNALLTAQAITSLHAVNQLDLIDPEHYTRAILNSRHKDGGWPEIYAFGDQKLMWGNFGQFVHGSESLTTAFCIEALVCLLEVLEQ